MKLLLIACSSSRIDEVREVVDRRDVHSFTEIPAAVGSGVRGRRLGTRAFPGEVSLFFTVTPAPKAAELARALADLAATFDPEEGLKIFALDATELL